MTERISATINGKAFTGEVPAEKLLLDFLRDRLAQEPGLTDGHDRPVPQRVAIVGIDVG